MTKNTKPTTAKEFLIAWMEDAIEDAKQTCKENEGDLHSYGAGYDQGFLDGLSRALDYLETDDEAEGNLGL